MAGTIAFRHPDGVVPFVCNTASVSEGAAVILDGSNDDQCVQSSTANPTEEQEAPLGLAKHAITATGQVLDIVMRGIFPAIAGGSITRGQLVTSNGDGTLIHQSAGAGVNVCIYGRALESASSTQRFAVDILRFVLQGH